MKENIPISATIAFEKQRKRVKELENECKYLKKSLEALYKELHSEQERRVIAQEGCMKLDAIMSAIVAAMPNDALNHGGEHQ